METGIQICANGVLIMWSSNYCSVMYLHVAGILGTCVMWVVADMKKGSTTEKLETCVDHKGVVVPHGDRYFPLGHDPCSQCTCQNGKPDLCISVYCLPPENCRQFHPLSDKCCEFVCLDRDYPNKASGNGTYPGKDDSDALNTTNLGLRLVASTVTSFLILALLLFMVHRLRQRRLLLMIRRFHSRRMDSGNPHLSRRFSEDDDGSIGHFVGHVGHDPLDFSLYDEPPPPYTLWKPPEMYIPPGEAPPPYDLSVQFTSPFPGAMRFSFLSTSQNEAARQQNSPAVVAENQVTRSLDTVLVTSVAINSNSAIRSTQPVECMPDVCNVSVVNDAQLNSPVIDTNDRVALPPDIQYEESQNYRPNGGVPSAQQETNAATSNLNEEDLANGNVIPNSAPVTSRDEGVQVASAICTCVMGGRKGRSWSKRHSCSEYVDQSRCRVVGGKSHRDKRLSLATNPGREYSSFYPDPTAWSGEASESSSSSSPTYDQPTLSPSTSDSSSVDVDFIHDSVEHIAGSGKNVAGGLAVVSSDSLQATAVKNRDLVNDITRPPHFQKTLAHLKKFSLIKRKKKKRRESKTGEISCSFVCQTVADSVLPSRSHSFTTSSDSLSTRGCCESNIPRPMEAINPHIGHKLASSGLKAKDRPASITVPAQHEPVNRKKGSRSSVKFTSVHLRDIECPLSPTVVAMHCSTTAKVNHITNSSKPLASPSQSPDLVCDGIQHSIVNQIEPLSRQSSSSLHNLGISRSGSTSSDMENRQHYKACSCASCSDTCRMNEEAYERHNHLDPALCSQCLSSVSVPSSSRAVVAAGPSVLRDSASSHSNKSVIKSIPMWIVNSMALLPRQDYEPQSSQNTSPCMSRCLSMGHIEENSFNSVSGHNVPVTLEIRDCDSSWEACSHL